MIKRFHGLCPAIILSATLAGPASASPLGPALVATLTAVPAEQLSAEETAERFLQILERNPRQGTALDRVYGYYVESGTLDDLVRRYESRARSDPTDATAWMILGLIEAKRGRDAEAIRAFQRAEAIAPDDPLAAYYLGKSLLLTGQSQRAAEAFERAVRRKPAASDLVEIYQALGWLYQRMLRNEEAVAVWNRLEQLFPDDLDVKEQIAQTLAEEEQPAQALKRYEALVGLARDDPYRRVRYAVEAANMKLRLGRKEDAIRDFEDLLGRLNPESWLYRQVRQRIEDVFRQEDDLAGLTEYYELWLGRHPQDIDVMTRLARTLGAQGRSGEALEWFGRAVRLAPGRTELRVALIDQLAREQMVAKAIAECAALDEVDTNNPDNVRQWGLLILKDPSLDETERKRRASEVWMRLLRARPEEPLAAVQVADLFGRAEMTDEALALYEKAVQLAPDQPQYREYLGQYLHRLGRSDHALAAWQGMAEGGLRNTENLARLADVLSGFGYRDEAIRAGRDACRLDPRGLDTNLKYAELLSDAERYEESLAQLEVTLELASDHQQRESILELQIENLQSAGRLLEEIENLTAELQAGENVSVDRWRRLARYCEAARKTPEAMRAAKEALRLDDRSVLTWRLAARVYQSGGSLAEAADAYRTLAALDPSLRTEYLTELAGLEVRLGRTAEALQTGREVIASAPSNPQHYQSFAELCFRLGQADEGLDALRRAVRLMPAEVEPLLALADASARHFMTPEAIELYWQALAKSHDLDDKLMVISRLAELYLRTSRLDRLLDRLERMRQQAEDRRETTFCIAQAHLEAHDYASGRRELESLLAENDRDTRVLQQLSALAEQEGDVETAIEHQLRLVRAAPDPQAKQRLAQLYLQAGRPEDAEAIWTELVLDERDRRRLLQSVDNLIGCGRYDTALSVTRRVVQQQPDDWEMLYREGVVLAGTGQPVEARLCFERILSLSFPDDTRGVGAASRVGSGPASSIPAFHASQPVSALARREAAQQIRVAAGLANLVPMQTSLVLMGRYSQLWVPADFGQARMAAIAWLLSLARAQGSEQELAARFEQPDGRRPTDQRGLWDSYYFHLVRDRPESACQVARQLSATGGLEAQQLYLSSLGARWGGEGSMASMPPLADDELDYVITCYRNVRSSQPDRIDGTILRNVLSELERAQRHEPSQRIYREALQTARNPDSVLAVMSLAAERGDVDGLLALLGTLEQTEDPAGSAASSLAGVYRLLLPVMSSQADKDEHADVIRLFEGYLSLVRARQLAVRWAGRSSGGLPTAGTSREALTTRSGTKRIEIDYPTPNEHYDEGAIVLLRHAFEIYRRDERLQQLVGHFEDWLGQTSGREQLAAWLGLSYLHAWSGDWESSAQCLEQAIRFGDRSASLLLDLSDLQSRLGDSKAALSTLDQIEALEQNTLIRREQAALRLAQRVGDLDRAREAAERLFGVRLPVEEQALLAAEMRQLGLEELADAVVRRAHRRGDSGGLEMVLNEYLRQNKTELALQVALQILRRPRSTMPRRGRRGGPRELALQVLVQSGKLDDLIAATEAQWRRSPRSIELMRSLVDYYLAANTPEKAGQILESLLAHEDRSIPPDALLTIAQDLEQYPAWRALVIRIYERAAGRELAGSGDPFQSAIVQRLLGLYRRANRAADARDLLLECWDRRARTRRPVQVPAYHTDSRMMIARQLHELGFPFDALRLYRDLAGEVADQPGSGLHGEILVQHVHSMIELVQRELSPRHVLENLPEFVRIEPQADAGRDRGEPAMDLMIFATSHSPADAAIASPVAEAMKIAREDRESLERAKRTIDDLLVACPGDFSVAIASAILEIASGTPDAKERAVRRVVQLVDDNPLAPLPAGAEPDPSDRSKAAAQVGLWLVARQCLGDEMLRSLGERLAARALEAARRQPDWGLRIAMLREQGQAALDRGDRQTAQAHWRELLVALLGRPAPAAQRPASTGAQPAAIKPVTPAAFAQACTLAKLALERGLPELSLECIREGLRSGAPRPDVAPLPTTLTGTFVWQPAGIGSRVVWSAPTLPRRATPTENASSVEQLVTEMDQLWRSHGVAPEDVYETLRSVVFPENVPDEILLYPRRLTEVNWVGPHSVGLLLARRAVESRRIDDLRKEIATRREHPSAALPARVLELQLAVACGNAGLAGQTLAWLSAQLEQDPQYATARLACHGVIPALQQQATRAAAAPVFERVASNLAKPPGDPLAAGLRMTLLLTAFEQGNVDEGIRQLYAYRDANENTLVRANSSRVHKLQIMEIGLQLARAGQLPEALVVLGDFVTRPHVFGRGQDPSSLVHWILRGMESKTPIERYELLEAWVLPNEAPRKVRSLAYFAPAQFPPEVFLGQTNPAPPRAGASAAGPMGCGAGGAISFTELLINAAGEVGKLNELEAEVQWAADQQFEGADEALTLVRVALGKREMVRPQIEAVLADLKHYLASEPGHRRLIQWHHYLLARASMRDEELGELGEDLARTLLDQAQRLRDFPFQTHLARQLHGRRLRLEGGGPGAQHDPDLGLWHPVSHQRASMNQRGSPPSWWIAREGRIEHLCGPELSFLYFNYPLTGTFEFSVDAYAGAFADAAVAYGGIAFEPLSPGEAARLWPVGGHDSIACSGGSPRADQYNRLSIEVRPGTVRYSCNGQVVYHDRDPSPTSPWLALLARGDRTTSWRNLQFTGRPEIPREVRLTHADRMEGWTAMHFDTFGYHGGSLPKRLSLVAPQSEPSPVPEPRPGQYEWSARDGVIHGRRASSEPGGGPVQSWLAYHRAMQSGETISYEFLYEPGRTMVHPTIGRLALLVEPDGVRLHWITDDRREMVNGLPADNVVDVPHERRGPKPLPFKADAWNTMAVAVTGDSVTLRLNDVEIYERRLERSNRRLFGLFHYSDRTAVQVRNAVLAGNWPESLSADPLSGPTASGAGIQAPEHPGQDDT